MKFFKKNHLIDQIREFNSKKFTHSYYGKNQNGYLVDFARYVKKYDISDIRAEDIEGFRKKVFEITSSYYQTSESIKAIRAFFRYYYNSHKRLCLNPNYIKETGVYLPNDEKNANMEYMKYIGRGNANKERNVEIIKLHLTDPDKWNSNTLSKKFNVSRTRIIQIILGYKDKIGVRFSTGKGLQSISDSI